MSGWHELLTQITTQRWFGVGGGIVFAIVYSLGMRQRAYALVASWAANQGLTILSAKRRTFVPFFGPAKGQFFRVRVADANGATKKCWLRFHEGTTKPEDVIVNWDTKA